jgi:hypothetical protein
MLPVSIPMMHVKPDSGIGRESVLHAAAPSLRSTQASDGVRVQFEEDIVDRDTARCRDVRSGLAVGSVLAVTILLISSFGLAAAANINSHHFEVRDLYTGEPIEGAEVSVVYGDELPGDIGFSAWNGKLKSAFTDADGVCEMNLLDMGQMDIFDWQPKAHFRFNRALVQVDAGRPFIKLVSCAVASGHKTVELRDGVYRFGVKYVGSASAVPGDKARQAGWGFMSVGSGVRFWLAPGKGEGEKDEETGSSSSASDEGDNTGSDESSSGGLSGWVEVVPNPCSAGSPYDVYYKFHNGTHESVTVNSFSNKAPKSSVDVTVSPGSTVVVSHGHGESASRGRWVNHPTFYTSAGTVDGTDYVFVVE